MQGHLSALGAWVAQLSYEQIPPRTLRAARLQLANMIAAAHAAAASHEVQPVLQASRALRGGGGRATIVPTGERAPLLDALFANAACSMAQDFDDIVWMGHTCHSAVFAPLAVAEHEGLGGRELITAIAAANEVGGRLGASSFLGPLNGQLWTFIHLAGAAAGAAKLLRLDAGQSAHALAIALAQPNFALQPAFLKPTSKLLGAATPAATGVQAAYLARAGMTGAPALLEDRRGFWRRFSFVPLPLMVEDLDALARGEPWTLDTLQIKTFPGCHYFQTALTALERLRAREPALSPARCRGVLIETTKLGVEVTRFAQEYVGQDGRVTPVSCAFDLAQSAAILLAAGRLTVGEVDEGWLSQHQPELRAWLERIQVRHDLLLTAEVVRSASRLSTGRRALGALRLGDLLALRRRYADEYASSLLRWGDLLPALRSALRARPRQEPPAEGGVPLLFPARVTVTMESGQRLVEQVDLPVGSVAAPGAEEQVRAKFAACVGARIGAERAAAAWQCAMNAEERSAAELSASFAPAAAERGAAA